jgi:hypothetical protein
MPLPQWTSNDLCDEYERDRERLEEEAKGRKPML